MSDLIMIKGGTGDASGAHQDNAGGIVKGALTVAQLFSDTFCGANGALKLTVNGANYDHDGGGGVIARITKAGAFPFDCTGWIARVRCTCAQTFNDRVEVVDWDNPAGNWIDINRPAGATGDDNNNCTDVYLGGALDTLQRVSDTLLAGYDNYEIWDYQPATVQITTQIDIDNQDNLSIFACSNTGIELAKGSYNTLDANNFEPMSDHALLNIEDLFDVRIFHYYALDNNEGGNGRGFEVTSNEVDNDGASFFYCKTTGCVEGFYAGPSANAISLNIIDCYITATGYPIYIAGAGGSITFIDSCYIESEGGTANYCVFEDTASILILENSILVGGQYGLGLDSLYLKIAKGNTFSAQTIASIRMNHASCQLYQQNNIFEVADAANDLAIKLDAGLILYSDYSSTNSIAANRWGGSETPEHAVDSTSAGLDANYLPTTASVLAGGYQYNGEPYEIGAVHPEQIEDWTAEDPDVVTGTASIDIDLFCSKELDMSTPFDDVHIGESLEISNSLNDHEVDKIWSDTRTLATGVSEELDLTNSLRNGLGDKIAFFDIKIFYIRNCSTTDTLKVGGAASGAFPIFNDSSDILVLQPDTDVAILFHSEDGLVVDDNDMLKIEHGGETANSLEYDIVITGLEIRPTPTPTPTPT
ncbi:MAG: hypothetical protein ACTSQB_00150 [Candidatus Heimdallarchaeota archaeon]